MRTEREVINQVLSYAMSVSDRQAVIRTNLVPIRKYLYSYEFYFIVKTDLIQTGIFIVALVGLCYKIFMEKRNNRHYSQWFLLKTG